MKYDSKEKRREISVLHEKGEYRPTVVCILYRIRQGQEGPYPEFLIQQFQNRNYSFIQGGIEESDLSIRYALRRELKEELGISEEDFKSYIKIERGFFFEKKIKFKPDREDKQGFKAGKKYFFLLAEYQGPETYEFVLDTKEIISAEWMTRQQAGEKFLKSLIDRPEKIAILDDMLSLANSTIIKRKKLRAKQ